jgi:hypothetical protein
MNKDSKIIVSDEFVKAYKLFNVIKLDLSNLSRQELLLLLVVAVDVFSEENSVVIDNFRPFQSEINIILDLLSDKDIDDPDLLNLANLTNEKYIDTSKIEDSLGNDLPKPLTNNEAIEMRRTIGIDKLI